MSNSMQYSKYRKGLKDIRKLLYGNGDPRILGHMGVIRLNRRNNRNQFNVIWNAKTDNVVAAKNDKGVVFVRENSIYAGQLLNSTKHKVISSSNMERFRARVPGNLRRDIRDNMIVEDALQLIRASGDRPGEFIPIASDRQTRDGVDMGWLLGIIIDRMGFEKKNFQNFVRTSNKWSFTTLLNAKGVVWHGVEIKDFSEEIERDRIENERKRAIFQFCLDNYDEIMEQNFHNAAGNLSSFHVGIEIDGVNYEAVIDGRNLRLVHDGQREIDQSLGFRLSVVTDAEEQQRTLHEMVMNMSQRSIPWDSARYQFTEPQYVVSPTTYADLEAMSMSPGSTVSLNQTSGVAWHTNDGETCAADIVI